MPPGIVHTFVHMCPAYDDSELRLGSVAAPAKSNKDLTHIQSKSALVKPISGVRGCSMDTLKNAFSAFSTLLPLDSSFNVHRH